MVVDWKVTCCLFHFNSWLWMKVGPLNLCSSHLVKSVWMPKIQGAVTHCMSYSNRLSKVSFATLLPLTEVIISMKKVAWLIVLIAKLIWVTKRNHDITILFSSLNKKHKQGSLKDYDMRCVGRRWCWEYRKWFQT